MKTKTKLRISEACAGISLFAVCFAILDMFFSESTSQLYIWVIVALLALFCASLWFVLKYNVENDEQNNKYW